MRLPLLIISFAAIAMLASGQAAGVRVAWYNVENLFDCRHDSLKEDQEFLPEGSYHWTPGRYWKKLDNIARVVAAVAGEEGAWPMAIGLCEVENDSCLRDLTRRSPLRIARYAYIHQEGPDRRGVDVALLYDSLQYKVLGHEAVRVPSAEHGHRPTRDILHVWGTCPTLTDTLHLIAVHLPSRAGSGRQGQLHRRLAMQTLVGILDRLTGKSVLLMGDFNAEPDDAIFRSLEGRMLSLMPQGRRELRKAQGTYVFRGQWGFLDHILVSPRLAPHAPAKATVGRFPFLLNEKGAPWRTFQGPVYRGGYSDHLPLFVDIR